MKKASPAVKQNIIAAAYAVIAVAGFLAIWQAAISFTNIGKLVPGPIKVLAFFFRSFSFVIGKDTIQEHALISLERVLIGYSVGIFLGIASGIGMAVSKLFEAIFKPLFEVIRPIPTIAWIPLAILWFGVGEMPKYFIIFYGAYANVTLNTYAAAKNVNPVLLGAARMLGMKEKDLLMHIILPSSIPQIFAGMQSGLSASWMGVIAAEMVKSNNGIGWVIIMGQESANTVQILAGMVAIAIMGFLMASFMRALEGRLCSWNLRKI